MSDGISSARRSLLIYFLDCRVATVPKYVKRQLEQYGEEWEELSYDLKVFKPKCQELGYCPEKRGCGKVKGKQQSEGE